MFEGLLQPMHLVVIFVVALLVFGPKNLPAIGKGLGQSIREFKKALGGEGEESTKQSELSKDEEKNRQ